MSADNVTPDIVQKVRNALAAIHAQGVIHGDIRLANILIGNDGTVWFIDFESSIFADSIQSVELRESMFRSERDVLTICLKNISTGSKKPNIIDNDYKILLTC